LISILSPVFKDIIVNDANARRGANTTVYMKAAVEYGGVARLHEILKEHFSAKWYFVDSASKVCKSNLTTVPPAGAEEVTAVISLKDNEKETKILGISKAILNCEWSGPDEVQDVLHVMYAEYFPSIDFAAVTRQFRTCSLDFCGLDFVYDNEYLILLIKEFDFIFVTEQDSWANTAEKLTSVSMALKPYTRTKSPLLIFHTPCNVRIAGRGNYAEVPNEYFQSKGVGRIVGNGDIFGYLLMQRLSPCMSFEAIISTIKQVQKEFLRYA